MNGWVSVWPSVPLQVNHPGKSGVFPSVWIFLMWVLVLNICKELYYENAPDPRRTRGTQLRFCTTPDSMTSFAIQPFSGLHCFFLTKRNALFSLLLSYRNEINCFLVCIKVWTRCEIKGTSMVLQQKPLWKWRHTNTEWQKIPSSPIFPLFQSTLG